MTEVFQYTVFWQHKLFVAKIQAANKEKALELLKAFFFKWHCPGLTTLGIIFFFLIAVKKNNCIYYM